MLSNEASYVSVLKFFSMIFTKCFKNSILLLELQNAPLTYSLWVKQLTPARPGHCSKQLFSSYSRRRPASRERLPAPARNVKTLGRMGRARLPGDN